MFESVNSLLDLDSDEYSKLNSTSNAILFENEDTSKIKFITVGFSDQIRNIPHTSIHLSTSCSSFTFTADALVNIRLLGANFDHHLSFCHHISNLSCTCFTLLHCIQCMPDCKTASTIATYVAHSNLDYCNSLFHNLESIQLKRLQLIQNSLARAVIRTPKHDHITPILRSLHWLKIPEQIHFKVLLLAYNFLQYSLAKYLHIDFAIQPTHCSQSSSCLSLSCPHLKFSTEPYPTIQSCSKSLE